MADELNVGKLVAEIIIESDTTAANDVVNKINEVNDAAKNNKVTLNVDVQHEEDLEYIRSVLEKIGVTGKEADKVLSGAFADTSGLKTYRDSLDIIAAKIDVQKKKVQELEKAMSKEPKFKSDWEEIEKATASIDKERIALQELEAKFDKTYAAQDSWVVKQVKSFQKQEAATDAAAKKQEKLNQQMANAEAKSNLDSAVRTLTSSLRTTDTILPDTIDNLSDLITQINAIKDAATKSGGSALGILSGGVAALGAVITIVTSLIEKYNEHKEEVIKKAQESTEALKNETQDLNSYRSQLKDIEQAQNSNTLTYSEMIENRKKLMEIQQELIEKYGKEAAAIDFVTSSIDEQQTAINNLDKSNAADWLAENAEAIRNAKNFFASTQNLEVDLLKYSAKYDDITADRLKSIGEAAEKAGWKVIEGGQATFKTAVPIKLEIEDADPNDIKDAYQKLTNELQDIELGNDESLLGNYLINEMSKKFQDSKAEIEKYKDTYDNWILNEIKDSEKLSNLYYAAAEAKEVYYEADQKGDLKGQEDAINTLTRLKTAFEENKGAVEGSEVVFSEFFDILTKWNSEEGKAERYANALNLKNQELNKTLKENANISSQASEAYKALSSGQKLSTDSLVELTEKYPELQKYIAETGDLSLQNGELLKKVSQEAIQRELDEVKSKRNSLLSKGELTKEEEAYIERLGMAAEAYEEQLNEVNDLKPEAPDLSALTSSITTSLSTIGSAWAQLEQGKKLDFNTTLSLINQYPEFAKAIADGSVSLEDQESVLRSLWEVEKQEAINSLELEKQKQLEKQKTANATRESLQAEIDSYTAEMNLRITMGAQPEEYADTLNYINSLKEKLKGLNNNDTISAIEAQIAAIQELNIETYNGTTATSDKNEALAEELKYMEHLKSLGQLTAEEELAWLERINSTYSKSKDEQYDMELKLYNAKKAWQEEQEKAINDALQNEYKYIGYNKSLNTLSKQQELDWLLRIRDQYALNAEQAIELQIKIYEAEKAIQEEREQAIADALQREYTNMSNQKSLDRLNSQQELEWLYRIQNTYELNYDQRIELEIKIHNLKKQLADEEQQQLESAYDKAIEQLERRKEISDNLGYDREINMLNEIGKKYRLTAEDALDLERRIKSLKNEKIEADKSALDKLGAAVTEALKNKYEQQREFEESLINQSIDNWKKWEDETVEAIQGQIDALDKLDEAQEQENKRQEYENKRQQTELQLAYEKDEYNRKQLQKELNRLDKEEAERLLQEERKAQREELEKQIDDVKKKSEAQQEALEKELEAVGENYDKLTSSFNLRAETEKTIMKSSQSQLIDLIKSYAPEYDLAGQSLGESLYTGFSIKCKAIEQMVTEIGSYIDNYQDSLQKTANAAADKFWARRSEYETQIKSQASPAKQDINLVVNFNEPVESPVQVQRRFAEVVENLAAEIKK